MNIKTVSIFLLLGSIWGSNFIYMKMAADIIDPMQIVFGRVLFGFIPLFFYALFTKSLKFTHLIHYKHFIVMSFLATTLYFFGFVKGSSLLLSGIAGALSGAIPLFSFLLALLFLKDEKITVLRLLGITVGFIGVVLISDIFNEDLASTNVEGMIYILLGSFSVGASFVYAKKFIVPLKIPASALTTYQLGFALLLMLFVVDFEHITRIQEHPTEFLGLVIGLGVLGTGVAYLLYYYIVEQFGAIKASSATYLPPVVALLIGVFIVGEQIGIVDILATGLIFLGVYLINKR